MSKFKYTPDWVRKLRGWPMNPPVTGKGYIIEELDITEEDADMWIEQSRKERGIDNDKE